MPLKSLVRNPGVHFWESLKMITSEHRVYLKAAHANTV